MSEAKTEAAVAAKPKAKKPRRKAKLDLTRLAALADEMGQYSGDLTGLIHRWETEEGMKARETSEGRRYVKLAGLEAGARGGLRSALDNWGNAARRAVLKGGA